MKRLIYILPLLLLCGCKNNEVTPPDPGVCPSEHVEGYITDETGNPLENILVEAYLDEELTQHYDRNYSTYPPFYTGKDGYMILAKQVTTGIIWGANYPRLKMIMWSPPIQPVFIRHKCATSK